MSKKNVKPDHPVHASPQPSAVVYAPPQVYPAYLPPQPPVDPYQSASAQILQDRNATVAKVSVVQSSSYDFGSSPDFSFTATGSSKREQGDRFNARTGELMSLSRAYLKLSRQLMSAARELVEPEPAPEYLVPPEFAAGAQEYDAPEDNFLGVGAYLDIPVLQDPTDEDVAMAKQILADRADFNAAVASLEGGEPPVLDEAQLDHAVQAFNSAAEALNNVRNVLGQFV